MKKVAIFLSLTALVVAFAGCGRDSYHVTERETEGTLSFSGFSVQMTTDVNEITRAEQAAPSDYSVVIYNSSTQAKAAEYTVGTLPAQITLQAGDYSVTVRSAATIDASAWETPVYGAEGTFSITAGQTTTIESLVCRQLNIKVSVVYNEMMYSAMGSDSNVKVEIGAGTLNYAKSETRAGFFAAASVSNTMVVKFSGTVEGYGFTTMTKAFNEVKACEWRKVSFVMTKDPEGNATFDITISDWAEDDELDGNVTVSDVVTGKDPLDNSTAPKVLYGSIAVPTTPIDLSTVSSLVFNITAEKGIKAFTVDITSTNAEFTANVATLSPLDLINPSAEQIEVCKMFGFTYGSDLIDKTAVTFDITGAITALSGFAGTHTFTLNITDNDDQKIAVPIILKVA